MRPRIVTRRLRSRLAKSGTVTEAIYDAGYNSNGWFYETSNRVLGMTPSNYRAGGAEIHFALGECSLGSILVARSARGICAILLGDDPNALARDLQDGAAAPHAVAADRCAPAPGRRSCFRSPPSPCAGYARCVSGEPPARRQPHPVGKPSHARRHFSRRQLSQVFRQTPERLVQSLDGSELLDRVVPLRNRSEDHPDPNAGFGSLIREVHSRVKSRPRDMGITSRSGFTTSM